MASTPAIFAMPAEVAKETTSVWISSTVSARVDTLGSRKQGSSEAEMGGMGLFWRKFTRPNPAVSWRTSFAP